MSSMKRSNSNILTKNKDHDDHPQAGASRSIAEDTTENCETTNNSNSNTVMTSSLSVPPFVPNQRVFAMDQGSASAGSTAAAALYEAVVRKTLWTGHQWTFYVHYLGWNARWDSWLDESQLFVDTPELRRRVQQQQKQDKKKRTRAEVTEAVDDDDQQQEDTITSTSQSRTSSNKKRIKVNNRHQQRRSVGAVVPSYADYCELPFTLKRILVEDRERIMRMHMDVDGDDKNDAAPRQQQPPPQFDCGTHTSTTIVVEKEKCQHRHHRPVVVLRDVHDLPARVTVKTVLDHYVKVKEKESCGDVAAQQRSQAFVDELSKLFDETLAVCLLYEPERAQYLARQAHPDLSQKRNCEVYGCEFLLRLFVRLPILLEEAATAKAKIRSNDNNNKNSDAASHRKEVGSQLADLIVLLQKNRQACFKAKYRPPRNDELNDYEKAFLARDDERRRAAAATKAAAPVVAMMDE